MEMSILDQIQIRNSKLEIRQKSTLFISGTSPFRISNFIKTAIETIKYGG